jgi:carotenoid cleavage dioxygenase-like enzyme
VDIELDHFFFGHFLNTWSPAPGKIAFDVNYQSQIFFDRFAFEVQSDKTKRDAWAQEHGDAYSTPTRYELDLETKSFTSKKLFPNPGSQGQPGAKWVETDLYKLHPEDYGKPYCGFWSQQAFFNSSSYASQAIVRAELCGDEPRIAAAWYRPNTYPGEAQFVPKPGSKDKTEGLLLFKTYEGDTRKSKLIVADATTLETVAEATIPIHVPFTVHGNWYPTDKAQPGHCIRATMETIVV